MAHWSQIVLFLTDFFISGLSSSLNSTSENLQSGIQDVSLKFNKLNDTLTGNINADL